MAATAAVIGIVATLASTGYGIYSSQEQAAQQKEQAKKQREAMMTQQQSALKSLVPGAKADAAARTGGGFSPDFLKNMIGTETGNPQGVQNIYPDIQQSLGGGTGLGGGIQAP